MMKPAPPRPVQSPQPDRAPATAAAPWVLRLGTTAAGAAGLSGLLYAAGFVVLRSHMSFWGLWPGPADDSATLVSEGGRLLYHLAFVFIDLLNPFPGGGSTGFQIFLLAALLLWAVPRAWWQRVTGGTSWRVRGLRGVMVLLPAGAAAVWGLLVLHELGAILAPGGLLNAGVTVLPDVARLLCRPGDVYFARVTDVVGLGALLATSVWALRLSANLPLRALVALDAAFLVAAISLLPAAYGRLMLLPDYPQIEFSRDEAHPLERVLVRATDNQWIVWNLAARRTEVVLLRTNETVTLGPRRRLAPVGQPSGVACGKT
jgi:hypothetical protein